MNKILFYLCLISYSFSFSQSNDMISYTANQNTDKWINYLSKSERGNVFDGIKEYVSRGAKICNINEYCLEVWQVNDGQIYFSLTEDYRRLGPAGYYNKLDDEIFLKEFKKRVESFLVEKNQGFGGKLKDFLDDGKVEKDKFDDDTSISLIIQIAFNNDPKTMQKFSDIMPNIERYTLNLNDYFYKVDSKDSQVILNGIYTVNGQEYSVSPANLQKFLSDFPNAEVLKPSIDFFNLLKSNSSIQIKLSGMGMVEVLSFSLKGSSKALSIFSLN